MSMVQDRTLQPSQPVITARETAMAVPVQIRAILHPNREGPVMAIIMERKAAAITAVEATHNMRHFPH